MLAGWNWPRHRRKMSQTENVPSVRLQEALIEGIHEGLPSVRVYSYKVGFEFKVYGFSLPFQNIGIEKEMTMVPFIKSAIHVSEEQQGIHKSHAIQNNTCLLDVIRSWQGEYHGATFLGKMGTYWTFTALAGQDWAGGQLGLTTSSGLKA